MNLTPQKLPKSSLLDPKIKNRTLKSGKKNTVMYHLFIINTTTHPGPTLCKRDDPIANVKHSLTQPTHAALRERKDQHFASFTIVVPSFCTTITNSQNFKLPLRIHWESREYISNMKIDHKIRFGPVRIIKSPI